MLPRISRVECHDADFLLFSTSDGISTTLFKTGKWESHLLEISKSLISGVRNPLILDIGANLGAYSIPLARMIQGIDGKVIAFEPQRIVYYQLCANVIINRLDNYFPIYSAVGESIGTIEIPEIDYEFNSNIGAFSINQKYREYHGIQGSMKTSALPVPMLNLDGFFVERSPALIKIDVEGYELDVLKGAVNFLATHNYPPILFEAWRFDWFNSQRIELLDFIMGLGYLISEFGTSDYIAQHPEHSVHIDFSVGVDGVLSMKKIK